MGKYFLEVSEVIYPELKKRVEAKGIGASVRDCTMNGEAKKHYHIDFGDISEEDAKRIARDVDECMGLVKDQGEKEHER